MLASAPIWSLCGCGRGYSCGYDIPRCMDTPLHHKGHVSKTHVTIGGQSCMKGIFGWTTSCPSSSSSLSNTSPQVSGRILGNLMSYTVLEKTGLSGCLSNVDVSLPWLRLREGNISYLYTECMRTYMNRTHMHVRQVFTGHIPA